MFVFSNLHYALVILVITVLCLARTVRSGFDPITLPSDYEDVCPETLRVVSCPVKCFRTDPVCGVDGVTYWCGCADAICAGTRVAKMGFCDVGIEGRVPVSGQALLLVHMVWLILLGFIVLFGLL